MSEHIEALREHLNRKGLTDMETQAHIGWLQQENAELKKDKERLDWLFKNNFTSWFYTRGAIDGAMNPSPSIFDEMSDKQRQQVCHEHGQPTQ